LWALCAAAYELRLGVSPVEKVITLLQDMRATALQEKQEEEVAFAKFHVWCDGTTKRKQQSVAEAAELIDQLQAAVQKADSDASIAGEAAQELDAKMAEAKKEVQAAQEVRAKEREAYLNAHADFEESIDAVQRAHNVLQSHAQDQAQVLLQLQQLPQTARGVLDAFVETEL